MGCADPMWGVAFASVALLWRPLAVTLRVRPSHRLRRSHGRCHGAIGGDPMVCGDRMGFGDGMGRRCLLPAFKLVEVRRACVLVRSLPGWVLQR